MNKAIKKEWIEALRSGKYKQGQGSLYRDGAYCCLGVLFDATQDGYWRYEDGTWKAEKASGWYGAEEGLLTTRDEQRLSYLNDRGLSFSDIARWIEENL